MICFIRGFILETQTINLRGAFGTLFFLYSLKFSCFYVYKTLNPIFKIYEEMTYVSSFFRHPQRLLIYFGGSKNASLNLNCLIYYTQVREVFDLQCLQTARFVKRKSSIQTRLIMNDRLGIYHLLKNLSVEKSELFPSSFLPA